MKKITILSLFVLFITTLGYAQNETFTATGSFVVPNGTTTVTVQAWGGGGGSGGHGTSGVTNGGAGGASTFSTITAGGGAGSNGATNNTPTAGAAGGTATGGTTNTPGVAGTTGTIGGTSVGGNGGSSPNGGAVTNGASAGGNNSVVGPNGSTPGGGAGGSARGANNRSTGGGGGGAYSTGPISGLTPGNSLTATVGTGGSAGAGNQGAGGQGGRGEILISWTCVNNLTSGNNNQTVCFNTPIAPITYDMRGGRGVPNVTGLPSGVTASFVTATGVLTISGTPTIQGVYSYTVTQTGSCAASFTGTITVNQDTNPGTASGNQTVCYGQQPTSNITLSGNSGSVIKWQRSETDTFTAPVDINVTSTTLTAAQIGNVFNTTYLRAVVQNGTCNEAFSNVVTLTIDNTIWDGSSWSNGTPTACKRIFINNGGAFVTGGTSIAAGTLTVSDASSFTISTGDFVELEGPLVVEQGSTFTVSNNSNLIQNNNVINQGTISVARQTAPLMRLDYVMWSAPVAGQNLLAFSPQTVTNRFYTYNPATNIYNVIAPASNSFQPGTGYLIRMPNNHPTSPEVWPGTFTGVPNNGDVNLTVTNNTFNAVGNPYPSTIDADEFITQNGITQALYFWRKTNNANTSSYATYTLAGGTGTDSNSGDPLALVPNGIIQVGQGFIVRSTSTQIQFNNSMRLHNTQNQFLRTSNTRSRIWLNITGVQDMAHQTMIAYMPGTTLGEDAGYDGRYFNDSPNALTSLIGETEYAVQARGEFEATDEVPLGFKTQTAGNYTISIGNLDGLFTGEQNIYLRDLLFGTDHDLKASAYTFSSDAGTFNERFRVVFQNTLSTPTVNESNNLIAFVSNRELMLDAGSELMSDVKIYDVRGSLVFEAKPDTTNFNAHLPVQGKQILLVQVTFQNGTTVVKKVAY